MPFNIVIVGGGLAASIALAQNGHTVTSFESNAKLRNIGCGISIPLNSMRVWDHLGLRQRLKDAAEIETVQSRYFRRYDTGKVICGGELRAAASKYE